MPCLLGKAVQRLGCESGNCGSGIAARLFKEGQADVKRFWQILESGELLLCAAALFCGAFWCLQRLQKRYELLLGHFQAGGGGATKGVPWPVAKAFYVPENKLPAQHTTTVVWSGRAHKIGHFTCMHMRGCMG